MLIALTGYGSNEARDSALAAGFDAFLVKPASLEAIEKIECLRYLEHGIPLKMVLTDYMGIEIDTPEDLLQAEKWLS